MGSLAPTATWMGQRLAMLRLTSQRLFRFPCPTAARRQVMADEIPVLVEPAATGDLTGLWRRRAEPVAVAERVAEAKAAVAVAEAEPVAVAEAEPVAVAESVAVAAAVAAAEPVAVMPESQTHLTVSGMFPSVAQVAVSAQVAARALAARPASVAP